MISNTSILKLELINLILSIIHGIGVLFISGIPNIEIVAKILKHETIEKVINFLGVAVSTISIVTTLIVIAVVIAELILVSALYLLADNIKNKIANIISIIAYYFIKIVWIILIFNILEIELMVPKIWTVGKISLALYVFINTLHIIIYPILLNRNIEWKNKKWGIWHDKNS